MPIRWPSISIYGSSNDVPRKPKRLASDPLFEDSAPSDADATHGQDRAKHLDLVDPGLSRIFTDAALYEQFVSNPLDADSGEPATSPISLYESLRGFSRLVGKDLDNTEKQASVRFAQLSVNNWAPDIFSEPTDIEEEEGSQDGVSGGIPGFREAPSSLSALEEHADDYSEEAEGALQVAEEADKLQPEEIVCLLEKEFGALADPGEEKLLLESDCALIHDVLLLVRTYYID
jgi:sterol 3beta-glucosyltransferase